MNCNSLTSSISQSKSYIGILNKNAAIPIPEIRVPQYTEEKPDTEGNYYGPFTGNQGGCFDGRYFYQSVLKYCYNKGEQYAGCHYVNNEKNIVRIVKYDILEKKVVAVSKEMDCLNHINDITYNSKTGQLVVCNSTGNKKKISFLNADTLEYEGYKWLNIEIYAIDYHAASDRYVLGVSSSRRFAIASSDFEDIRIDYGELEPPRSYTKQNICCNDEYVYCLYSGKKGWKDAVFVYDWEGHFVTFIELDFGEEEPENLSVHNGALFVGTGNHKQVFFYNISGLKMLK